MKIFLFITLLIVTIFFYITVCSSKRELKVGDVAPDFILYDQNGVTHSLSEYRGKKVALYFYPKDDTSGCKKQACSIRDNFNLLNNAGITVLGLSKGSLKSKSDFATKYSLPFTLLIADEKTLSDYGACGNIFRFYLPKRRTFLIDENGIIVAILNKIDVNKHAQQIIDAFNQIQR